MFRTILRYTQKRKRTTIVINLILLSFCVIQWLIGPSAEQSGPPYSRSPQTPTSSSTDDILDLDPSSGFYDKFRMFKSHMFVVTGSNWSQLSTTRIVCMGSQTSVDRF